MTSLMRNLARRARVATIAFRTGTQDIQPPALATYPRDFMPEDIAVCDAVRPYTMTSDAAIWALCNAVRYVVSNGIPGALVECGVWRGGSMMAVALTLERLGVDDRDLYLFDTFEGMPAPTEDDFSYAGESAADLLAGSDRSEPIHAYASEDDVRLAMAAVHYPIERIHLVRGLVEETLPAQAPDEIALLRLDTDWYASTRHGLDHLFPRMATGGVLILDDYGYWRGARKATDEYIAETGTPLLLNRIDRNARIAVKP